MMETFAEAWVAANTQTPLTEAAAAAADHVSLFSIFLFFYFLFYFFIIITSSSCRHCNVYSPDLFIHSIPSLDFHTTESLNTLSIQTYIHTIFCIEISIVELVLILLTIFLSYYIYIQSQV